VGKNSKGKSGKKWELRRRRDGKAKRAPKRRFLTFTWGEATDPFRRIKDYFIQNKALDGKS